MAKVPCLHIDKRTDKVYSEKEYQALIAKDLPELLDKLPEFKAKYDALTDKVAKDKANKVPEPVDPNQRQKDINDLIGKKDAYNKLRSNSKERAAAEEKLKQRAAELGLVFKRRGTTVRIESKNGNLVKANRSFEGNQAVAEEHTPLEKRGKESQDLFNELIQHGTLAFPEVLSADGKRMSKKQLETAIADVINGTPTNGAESLLNSIDETIRTGNIDVKHPDSGETASIPLKDYLDSLKEGAATGEEQFNAATEEERQQQADDYDRWFDSLPKDEQQQIIDEHTYQNPEPDEQGREGEEVAANESAESNTDSGDKQTIPELEKNVSDKEAGVKAVEKEIAPIQKKLDKFHKDTELDTEGKPKQLDAFAQSTKKDLTDKIADLQPKLNAAKAELETAQNELKQAQDREVKAKQEAAGQQNIFDGEKDLEHIAPGGLMLAGQVDKAVQAIGKIAKGLIQTGAATVKNIIAKIKAYLADKFPKFKLTEEMKDQILKNIEEEQKKLPTEIDMIMSGMSDEEIDTELDSRKVALDRTKITQAVAQKKIELDKKQVKDQVSELIFNRRVGTDLANYESALFVHGINNEFVDGKKISKEQRETIPFLIEKTDIPDALNRPDLQEILKDAKQREDLEKIADKVRGHFDEKWKEIVANTDKLSTDQIEDYVTHIWDIPKNEVMNVTSWFATKNKFLNKRYIATLQEGIEKFGLTPKHLDISDIIAIHDQMANVVINNNKFVEGIKGLEKNGMPMMLRADQAPATWVTVDHPALTTNLVVPRTTETETLFGTDKETNTTIIKMPYKVDPDLAGPMKIVFDSKINHPVIAAYEKLKGIMGKTALSISLFHHGALTEASIPLSGPLETAKAVGKSVIYDGIKQKFNGSPLYNYPEEARDAIGHGVKMGSTLDIPTAQIQGIMDNLKDKTKDIPVLKNITDFASSFNEKWDSLLWNYLHDSMKLHAYMTAKEGMPEGTKDPDKYLREKAQFINDVFGGQNWDVLGVSPKSRQILNWFLLSPDWTVSKIREALAPIGVGSLYDETKGIRAKSAGMFWVKAAFYYGIGMNILNYYYRAKDKKEHPEYYPEGDLSMMQQTMWGNSLGHKTHLFTGRYKDGSERYVRWGKEFREVPELIMDEDGVSFPRPLLRKLGGKASQPLQLGAQLLTGHSLSGYENWDLKDKKGWDYTLAAMKTTGKAFLPFSSEALMRDDKEWTPTDVMYPSSKGLTKTGAINLFKKGIAQNDIDYVKEVYTDAVRNNLDPIDLFKTALRVVKTEGTRELERGLKTQDAILETLKHTTKPAERESLKGKLKQIKHENKERQKGFSSLDNALKDMDKLSKGESTHKKAKGKSESGGESTETEPASTGDESQSGTEE